MQLAQAIKRKFGGAGGERVLVVYAREHHVELVQCEIEASTQLVRSAESKLWPKPPFDPKPFGKDLAYLALGEKIVPWPTREKPAYDVTDDGDKIEITPEYLDSLANNQDAEALLHGAGGMSLQDKLVWLGAGAAIGMILTYFLLRLVGFGTGHAAAGGGSATTVTITNASANATTLAQAAFFPFFARIAPRGSPGGERSEPWEDLAERCWTRSAVTCAVTCTLGFVLAVIPHLESVGLVLAVGGYFSVGALGTLAIPYIVYDYVRERRLRCELQREASA